MNKTDGQVIIATKTDIKAGAILRETSSEGFHPMFPDSVVVSVKPFGTDKAFATLSRVVPMVSSTGAFYTHVSTIEVEVSRLVGPESIWRLVTLARGAACNVAR